MSEHAERVTLKVDDNFITELRRNLGNVRRAAVEVDRRLDAELIAKIDNIPDGDPEIAHGMLDDLLESRLHPEVREAIQRLKDRCDWWAAA